MDYDLTLNYFVFSSQDWWCNAQHDPLPHTQHCGEIPSNNVKYEVWFFDIFWVWVMHLSLFWSSKLMMTSPLYEKLQKKILFFVIYRPPLLMRPSISPKKYCFCLIWACCANLRQQRLHSCERRYFSSFGGISYMFVQSCAHPQGHAENSSIYHW